MHHLFGTHRNLAVRVAGQCVLLWLLYEAGSLIAQASRLPLPGNLLGLLLLLALLETGIVRATEIGRAHV